MWTDMKVIRKEQLALIVLIAVQVVFMVYWGTQKSGYYVDEFFTFDNAHYSSASTPDRIKLYDADFLTYDKWYEISDLKSTLTVTREESLFSDSVGYNIKAWVAKYPYMVLLNYVQAVFFEGKFSKWSAISVNILLFLLNQLILYRLTAGISRDKAAAVVAVALYGFSGMAASMTVYVRFYMLVTLWMTLYTYLHMLMWQEHRIVRNLLMEFLSVAVLYLAYKDSPLAVIQGVGLICAFLAGLILQKRYKQAAVYGFSVVGGGLIYVLSKTDYVKYFLQPEKYANAEASNSATAGLLENFLTLAPGTAVERTIELAHIICRYLFGHILVLAVYLLLVTVLLVWYLCGRRNKTDENGMEYFFLAVCPCAFFCIVSVCLDLGTTRYNSSIFPELAVCVSVLVIYLAVKVDKKRLAVAIMGIIVMGEIATTVSLSRVDNLYQEDGKVVEQIQSYHGMDSVVVDYFFDDNVLYECLVFAEETARVMFVSYGSIDYDAWSDDVLLWIRTTEGKDLLEDLEATGCYTVEKVAGTHTSDVYFVSRHIPQK